MALVLLAALPSLIPNAYVQYVINTSLILAFATIGLNVIFGYAGQHAFGFPVFFGLGAYVSALLAIDGHVPVALAIPAGGLITGLLSVVIGLPAFRLRGIYFGVGTIAFAYVIYIIAQNWVELTRGPMGIPLVPPLRIFPEGFAPNIGRDGQTRLAVIIALGCVIFLVDRLMRSPTGRAWLAIRENEHLAASLGISALRYQMAAFALGAAISGLGGGFHAHYVGFISPTELGFHYIGIVFIMLIAGGTSTLSGPLIGAVVFGVLPELLRVAEMARNLLLGVILLFCIAVVPEGLVGAWNRLKRVWTAPRQAGAVTPAMSTAARMELTRDIAPPATSVGALDVCNVTKAFDGLTALDDVSFTVQPGEIVGLIGPNGAGKTTLFNIITGVLSPSSGRIQYCGRDIAGHAPSTIAALGVTRTYQITSLFSELSTADNIRTATHLRACRNPVAALVRNRRFRVAEGAVERTVNQILALIGLEASRDVQASALSYGDQRRLEVAIALATGARLILLDEPAAGLNGEEKDELCALIRRLQTVGFTLIIIEHDMRMVMSLCERIVVLSHGRKIFDGSPTEAAINPEVIEAYLGTEVSHA